MELIKIVCASCGANAEIGSDARTAKCGSCFSTLVVEISAKLSTVELDEVKR